MSHYSIGPDGEHYFTGPKASSGGESMKVRSDFRDWEQDPIDHGRSERLARPLSPAEWDRLPRGYSHKPQGVKLGACRHCGSVQNDQLDCQDPLTCQTCYKLWTGA